MVESRGATLCRKQAQQPCVEDLSLHCSSFLGLPYRILTIKLARSKKGTTMETTGRTLPTSILRVRIRGYTSPRLNQAPTAPVRRRHHGVFCGGSQEACVSSGFGLEPFFIVEPAVTSVEVQQNRCLGLGASHVWQPRAMKGWGWGVPFACCLSYSLVVVAVGIRV